MPLNEIAFHLSDECNLRCKDCHWFSYPINSSGKVIPPEEYLKAIERLKPKVVRLTGGEPFLYPFLKELITKIPEQIKVKLFSNGSLINEDNLPMRSNLTLLISDNADLDRQHLQAFISQLKQVSFISFRSDKQTPITLKNQLEERQRFITLLNQEVICTPNMLRFGTDGHAYYCENGLRTKDPELRLPLSLWYGRFERMPQKHCRVNDTCLSNFTYEQNVKLINNHKDRDVNQLPLLAKVR